jgi:hypothetical protein
MNNLAVSLESPVETVKPIDIRRQANGARLLVEYVI